VTIHNCLERYFLLKRNSELLDELAHANLMLEQKVQQRTEDLELRNRALEFSQTMLGNLPVGVVGIDENGLIAHCNSVAANILKQLCDDFLGTDIEHFCDRRLKDITEQVLSEKKVALTDTFGDRMWKVLGRTISFADSEAVVLVFLEV